MKCEILHTPLKKLEICTRIGAAEPIRFLLQYLGQPFSEYNPASREAWIEKKKSLGVDFPNLPYIKDGDFYLSESSAIPLYLAGKAGRSDLFGKDGKDQAVVRQIQGVMKDISESFSKVIWASGAPLDELLAPESSTSGKIAYLSKFLGQKEYFLGYLTYADIEFASMCQFMAVTTASHEKHCPMCVHPNLAALFKRIIELPGIKDRITASADMAFIPAAVLKFKLLTWNSALDTRYGIFSDYAFRF